MRQRAVAMALYKTKVKKTHDDSWKVRYYWKKY